MVYQHFSAMRDLGGRTPFLFWGILIVLLFFGLIPMGGCQQQTDNEEGRKAYEGFTELVKQRAEQRRRYAEAQKQHPTKEETPEIKPPKSPEAKTEETEIILLRWPQKSILGYGTAVLDAKDNVKAVRITRNRHNLPLKRPVIGREAP